MDTNKKDLNQIFMTLAEFFNDPLFESEDLELYD